jgi:hypothetical protein
MDKYDYRQARILGLTREEALKVLGFPPNANPSEAELKAAKKKRALEAHPDRGGSMEQMQDINRAFDFLTEHDGGGGHGSYDYRDESGQETYAPETTLDRELVALKKRGYWSPGKNMVVNVTLMGGVNLWYFSIIPRFYRDIYRPARNCKPEGIVIDPGWHPYKDGDSSDPTPHYMDKVVELAKKADLVSAAVKEELKNIEQKFSVQIPSAVEAKLVKEADKVAKRRWGVNTLRARKILVPFDGSKAIELGSWD